MKEEMAYYCDSCHKVIKKTGEKVFAPECCGKGMELLSLSDCMKDPAWAEHARFDDNDEPCDPGT